MGEDAREPVHFVGEDFFAWATDRVVGRYLDHDLVKVLNDVLELLWKGVSAC